MVAEALTPTPEFHPAPVDELEFLRADDESLGDDTREFIGWLQEYGLVVGIGVHESQLERLAEIASQEHISGEFCASDPIKRFGNREQVLRWLQKGTGETAGRVMVGIYAVKALKGDSDENEAYSLYGSDGELQLSKASLSDEEVQSLKAEDVVQLSYGWFGSEPVEALPESVDVTTAYRVSKEGQAWARLLSAERQRDDPEAQKLRMGLVLGRAVLTVITEKWHIERRRIGLEAWHSNYGAIGIYNELGFRHIASARGERPSKGREVGNSMVLTFDDYDIPDMVMHVLERDGGRMVEDVREYMVLATDEELARESPRAGDPEHVRFAPAI